MLAATLTALLLSLPPLAPQDATPPPERVEQVVGDLERAFKDGDAAARAAAIQAGVGVVDARVIAQIAKGLKDKDTQVSLAAMDALGRMHHPDAAAALNAYYKRAKKELAKDEDRLAALLKAVGRQGDPSGIDVLLDSPMSAKGYPVIQARILGLGNIRDAAAVEGVFSLMGLVGKRTADSYMGDIRLALLQLTGEDRGLDPLQWEAWWRDHKKGYELPAARPLPDPERARWNAYWGIVEKRAGEKS
jgi:HEAT repeats